MKQVFGSLSVIVILLVGIFILSSIFVVSEGQQVVVTEFGKPKGGPIQNPGLYFKLPVAQHANYFDKRILEWDGDANRIPTKDKRYIWIDTTARWRIIDPLKFMQSVRNEDGAQQRLDAVLDGTTRNVIADRPLIEIVRSSNDIFTTQVIPDTDIEGQRLEKIPENSGRENLRQEILKRAKPKVRAYGIELVDILIKRVNYEREVRLKVFDRMISERKRVADRYRSEGESERARIEGLKEKRLKQISSEAYKQSQIIRGKADAEAIKIYANAYNNDPEFYSFLRTLDSYRDTLGEDTTLVIGTDNDYFGYLKQENKP